LRFRHVYLFIISIVFATFAQAQADPAPRGCNEGVSIALSTIGLCLSAAAIPSPIIGLTGAIDDNPGRVIYGYAVGPGLNITGGILSCISTRLLDNKCNADGAVYEVSLQRDKVKRMATMGSILGSIGFIGLIMFMTEPNDLTFKLTVPVPVMANILNVISGAKATRTAVKFKNRAFNEMKQTNVNSN
jgi:hypothetical protein